MKKRVKRQHGTSLHASGEDYLEAVLVLQKEKGMVRSVDVARHMGVSKPSVCHAVAKMRCCDAVGDGRGTIEPSDRISTPPKG